MRSNGMEKLSSVEPQSPVSGSHPKKWRVHRELPHKSFSSYQEVLCLFLKPFKGKKGVKIMA